MVDLMALHLNNALHLFYVYLSHLFTTMLYYCFTPKSVCISTMIPIPKGSNIDTSDIRNYRGIAPSSLLSKLFDSCIIWLNTVVFKSDDLQFVYKKRCSTIQCVSIGTEVIDYNKNNGSPVYMWRVATKGHQCRKFQNWVRCKIR